MRPSLLALMYLLPLVGVAPASAEPFVEEALPVRLEGAFVPADAERCTGGIMVKPAARLDRSVVKAVIRVVMDEDCGTRVESAIVVRRPLVEASYEYHGGERGVKPEAAAHDFVSGDALEYPGPNRASQTMGYYWNYSQVGADVEQEECSAGAGWAQDACAGDFISRGPDWAGA